MAKKTRTSWMSFRTIKGKKVRVKVRKFKSDGKTKYSVSRLTHKGRVADAAHPYKSDEPWEEPRQRKEKYAHHALSKH